MTLTVFEEDRPTDAYVPPEKVSISHRIKTVATLSVLAFLSYRAERNGSLHGTPEMLRFLIQSSAHPVIGYVGAWFGYELFTAPKMDKVRGEIALAAATTLNITSEVVQDAVSDPRLVSWHQNLPETTRDLAAAMAGYALYVHQSRSTSDLV